MTVGRWKAYEEHWRLHPTVDDLAAWYLQYEPPRKPGEPNPEIGHAMGPEEFLRFVKSTGGSRLGPTA